jgi:hypothetical protein
MVNYVYFRLPVPPLLLSLKYSAFQEDWGAILAYKVLRRSGNIRQGHSPGI